MSAPERLVIARVRAHCAERDGLCWFRTRLHYVDRALSLLYVGDCGGPSEWAHLGPWRRFHTRGKPPEERHTPEGSVMLCRAHHRRYDAHKFDFHFGAKGAEGHMIVAPFSKYGA